MSFIGSHASTIHGMADHTLLFMGLLDSAGQAAHLGYVDMILYTQNKLIRFLDLGKQELGHHYDLDGNGFASHLNPP